MNNIRENKDNTDSPNNQNSKNTKQTRTRFSCPDFYTRLGKIDTHDDYDIGLKTIQTNLISRIKTTLSRQVHGRVLS